MLSKTAFVLSVFAISAQVAVATPPACLLAAVNTQQDPWNLEAICGQQARQVVNQIQGLCGANMQAAMSAFQETCKSSGHTVANMGGSTTSSGSMAAQTGTTSSGSGSSQTTSSIGSSSSGSVSGSSGVAAPTGGLTNPSSNGTSINTAYNPPPVAQPSTGLGSPTSSGAVPDSTGAAGRAESQGLAGFVLAAAGLMFLL